MPHGPSHPLALLALGTLLLNDHVLKAAWGNAFTGKIGDVAVLIVGPVLLAAVLVRLGLKERWAGGLALAFNAVFFTVLQLWPPLGDAWCAVFGGVHTPDPTDLLCLPALALAPLCWKPRTRPLRFALPAMAMALCATSYVVLQDPCAWRPLHGVDDHDPNAPLRMEFHAPSDIPDGTTQNFLDDVEILRDGKPVPFEVVQGAETRLLLCPKGGLEPDTEYTWRVGPFRNLHATQIPVTLGGFPTYAEQPDPYERTFRTAPTSKYPALTRKQCEGWLGARTERWGECDVDPFPTDTGDSGGSGL